MRICCWLSDQKFPWVLSLFVPFFFVSVPRFYPFSPSFPPLRDSFFVSLLCFMSVRRGKGVAQPETRLALLCWLANAPHYFCLSSLLSLGSPSFVFVFTLAL
jgi:hypothetical protein